MTKTDCFGYDEKKCGCKALKKLYCENEECNFYKTKEQVQKEKKKYERMRKNVAFLMMNRHLEGKHLELAQEIMEV